MSNSFDSNHISEGPETACTSPTMSFIIRRSYRFLPLEAAPRWLQ
jgi:hypothetical protein